MESGKALFGIFSILGLVFYVAVAVFVVCVMLIVSHGAFIRHILKELVPHLHMAESPKNTSLTKLIQLENGWDSELYNCTVHLG